MSRVRVTRVPALTGQPTSDQHIRRHTHGGPPPL